MIISIEGIDGAGKNTLTKALRERIDADLLTFPRYADSIHAQLAARALRGEMGDMTDSPYAMATMFALDRHGVAPQLRQYAGSENLLLLDRYVASNAAYSWARTQDDAMPGWIAQLEFEDLGLPRPDLQVLLDTPVELAAERAERRAQQDASRKKDIYESDGGLQARTSSAYRRLAAESWGSEWLVAAPDEAPEKVAERIIARITAQKYI